MIEKVNHPEHYGGEGNPYEAIKIIEATGYGEGFTLGNALKYILRAGNKQGTHDAMWQAEVEDLKKAAWYINRRIEQLTESKAAQTPKKRDLSELLGEIQLVSRQ